jgi:hypothetical protein
MKKKKSDPPHDFVVDDADVAFGKLEDATRRLLTVPKPKIGHKSAKKKSKRN